MKQRIELHIESSYSYKNKGIIITPRSLLEKCKDEHITAIGITDYCNCASIPEFEKLKREMKLNDVKIIYGITLNIKYDDLYVPTVILAKNETGIKNLYKIVSKMNEDECYFILKSDLDKYKDGLILGITKFNFDEDYSKVIKYYTYIEINQNMCANEIAKLNEYCKINNLLLIATSLPKRANRDHNLITKITSNLYSKFYYFNNDEYYYETNELLLEFGHRDNAKEVVIDNPKKIADLVEYYNLDFNTRYMIEPKKKGVLKSESFERANLIYIEDIPKNVKDRLNYELDLIEKYNLEGTILLLENIIHRAKKNGGYATVGSFLSHSLVAYLMGLIEINPMDLDEQTEFINDFESYGFHFEICVSENIRDELIEYTRKLLGQTYLYQKSNLYGYGGSLLTRYFKDNPDISDINQILISNELSNIKRWNSYLPHYTYFLIPSNIDITDITPTNVVNSEYVLPNTKSLEFSNALLNSFVSLRFYSNDTLTRIEALEEQTDFFREDIPLDDNHVLNNTYKIIENNGVDDYKSYLHWSVKNNYSPELIIQKDELTREIKSLCDLINLRNTSDSRWLSKVVNCYYDAYFRTYYENAYYEIYFKQIIEIFNHYEIYDEDFLNAFNEHYRNNKIDEFINSEDSHQREFILKLMLTMYEKGLDSIVMKLANKYRKELDNG